MDILEVVDVVIIVLLTGGLIASMIQLGRYKNRLDVYEFEVKSLTLSLDIRTKMYHDLLIKGIRSPFESETESPNFWS